MTAVPGWMWGWPRSTTTSPLAARPSAGAEGAHVDPDVTIQGRDRPSPSECAVAILACIGNEAEVITGEAKGGKGYYIGRHAGSDDKVWVPKDGVEERAREAKGPGEDPGCGAEH